MKNGLLAVMNDLGITMSAPDPDEIRSMGVDLGLELTDEECSMYSADIRTAHDARAACAACVGLDGCTVEPAGIVPVFSRTSSGLLQFSVKKCPRRLQYEDMLASERLLASSRIPEYLRSKSFKSFDGQGNAEAKRIAGEIIRDKNRKGMIMYGAPGVGKTHLAASVLNNRIIHGDTGIYATVPELMDDLRSAMRSNTIEQARQAILETGLLFLDDIGAENPSEFVVEELFKIINGRMLRGRQIIGTTNLSPSHFQERYAGIGGSRIVSRLYEICEWVEVVGVDRRV